jgi:hypothetical protein
MSVFPNATGVNLELQRPNTMTPRINRDLLGRLETFNHIGALPSGGNCRLALSDEDRAGRDLLVQRAQGDHRRDRQHRRRARRARGLTR